MQKALSTISSLVRAKKLREPFDAAALKRVYPGLSDKTYRTFLSKYAVGNPLGKPEIFLRVAPGRYRLKPDVEGPGGARLAHVPAAAAEEVTPAASCSTARSPDPGDAALVHFQSLFLCLERALSGAGPPRGADPPRNDGPETG